MECAEAEAAEVLRPGYFSFRWLGCTGDNWSLTLVGRRGILNAGDVAKPYVQRGIPILISRRIKPDSSQHSTL